MMKVSLRALAPLAFLALAHTGEAATVTPGATSFITLGTMGGPVPDGQRSQPANAIVRGDRVYLVGSSTQQMDLS